MMSSLGSFLVSSQSHYHAEAAAKAPVEKVKGERLPWDMLYFEEVERRRVAEATAESLRVEVEKLKKQLASATKMVNGVDPSVVRVGEKGEISIFDMHTSVKKVTETAFFPSEVIVGPLLNSQDSKVSASGNFVVMCTGEDTIAKVIQGTVKHTPPMKIDLQHRVCNVKVTQSGALYAFLGSKGVVRLVGMASGSLTSQPVTLNIPTGSCVVDMDEANGRCYVLTEHAAYIIPGEGDVTKIPLQDRHIGCALNCNEAHCAYITINTVTNDRTLFYFHVGIVEEVKKCHVPATQGGRFMLYNNAAYICCRSTEVVRIELATSEVSRLPLFRRENLDFLDITFNPARGVIVVLALQLASKDTTYMYEVVPKKDPPTHDPKVAALKAPGGHSAHNPKLVKPAATSGSHSVYDPLAPKPAPATKSAALGGIHVSRSAAPHDQKYVVYNKGAYDSVSHGAYPAASVSAPKSAAAHDTGSHTVKYAAPYGTVGAHGGSHAAVKYSAPFGTGGHDSKPTTTGGHPAHDPKKYGAPSL